MKIVAPRRRDCACSADVSSSPKEREKEGEGPFLSFVNIADTMNSKPLNETRCQGGRSRESFSERRGD